MNDAALRKVRTWLGLFMVGLVLSGVTAFPLVHETRWLLGLAGPGTALGTAWPAMASWLDRVHQGLADAGAHHPFLAYGTDWLAFAHLVIALAFVGPWRDPVKNAWVVDWGLLCCLGVPVLVLVCGPLRGIPWFWMVLDCSFGVLGAVPLLAVRRLVARR